VQTLLRHRAALDVRVPSNNPNKQMSGKTPLELAALDGSRFPKHMMHVLAPCLNSELSEPTFFSDIYFLVGLNEDAALEVVRELGRRSIRQPELLQKLRYDSQLSGRTDMMAATFYEAPSAASEMLDLLMVEPDVQDVAKHNVPNKTSLWGLFNNVQMRCTYRPDVVIQDHVLVPSWKFDSQKSFEQQPNIQWHAEFIPAVHKSRQSRDHVSNVCVKALLIPNMLDMDVIMAISRVEEEDLPVFSKLSIQGIVHCLWENLFQTAWYFNLFCIIIELLACVCWGLAGIQVVQDVAMPRMAHMCWAIMTAGGLRDVLQVIVLIFNWGRKQVGHNSPQMKQMWSLRSSLLAGWCFPSVLLSMIQLVFSYSTYSLEHELTTFPEEELLFLAMCVLFRSWIVIYMCRLHASGLPIHAISNSLVGGATRQILVITLMIFASFCFAFLIIERNKDKGWIFVSAFRALLFGSGKGFDNLGLDVGSKFGENDAVMVEVSLIGSSFFCVIVLNLIIAVYSSEYNRVQGDIPHHFLHSRAKYCLLYFLSGHTLAWRGPHLNRLVLTAAVLLCVFCVAWPFYLNVWIVALLLAFGELAIMAALLQCDWFSMEGVAYSKEEHFLWICHRADETAGSLGLGSEATAGLEQVKEKLADVRAEVDTCWAGLQGKTANVDQKLDQLSKFLQS